MGRDFSQFSNLINEDVPRGFLPTPTEFGDTNTEMPRLPELNLQMSKNGFVAKYCGEKHHNETP